MKTVLPVRLRVGWRFVLGAIASVTCATCATVLCASSARLGDDDLTALLRAYSATVADFERSDPAEDARRQFYSQWLHLLMGEYDSLPSESVPDAARVTCLSLANGVQDYALAESIAFDGAIFAPTGGQRLVYWDQRVGLREAIAARTGDPQDAASIRAMAEEVIRTIRPTLQDPLYRSDPVAVTRVQRIFGVAADRAGADGDLPRAIALLEESAAFVDALPPEVMQSVGFNWWPDQCLQNAARHRIGAGDIEGASAELRRIDSCEVRRASASEHALICAGEAVPLGSFREEFAKAWLGAREPWDASEVRMAYALAFSLLNRSPSNNDRIEESVVLLEDVLAHSAALAQADAAVSAPLVANGRPPDAWVLAPISSNALVCLARAYNALGWDDECEAIATMVVTEYPDHPAASLMRGMAEE